MSKLGILHVLNKRVNNDRSRVPVNLLAIINVDKPALDNYNSSVADIDECSQFAPCSNGGRCVNIIGGYSCACQAGWHGVNCTRPVDTCHYLRCLNGGTCSSDPRSGQWQCTCPRGFSGRQCELRIGPCRPNPCNGGECQILTDGDLTSISVYEKSSSANSYRCTCPIGRFGKNCEHSEPGYRPQQTKRK